MIVIRKMLKKLKDLGSLTLPIQICDNYVVHALNDLRASINLMPLYIFNTLRLGKLMPCYVVLQMMDRTRVHPKRIIEDVLIKVGKFIFPSDFVVLDCVHMIGYLS